MSLDDVQLHRIETPDDVAAFQRWLGERRPVHALGYDTETTGLDVHNDDVRLIQFGDGEHGWAMDREDWLGLARWVFKVWDGRYIIHNALFDVPITAASCGIDIPRERVDDTLVTSRINEPHYSAALKNQAERHVDPAAAGLAYVLADTSWTWETVPTDYPPYWQYGALDPVLAYHLWLHHGPIVQREAPASYDLELSVLWVLERMMRNGVHVDRALAARKQTDFESYCEDVAVWCQTNYRVKPGSNDAVIAVLRTAGHEFTKLTKSGRREALDSDVLEGIAHPLARAVLTRRQLQKIASTYLRAFVELTDENDIIHPGINPQGALTSRMSMENPNLQNLPVRGTNPGGEVVRRCVDSRYGPDGRLVLCDFDQVEMRLLAHLSQDDGLIQAFHSDGDFFVNLARQIFDDPTIVKGDTRRQVTKNASYANAYGAGIHKFALTAGITDQQASDFMTRYRSMYPGVPRLQQTVQRVASQRLAEEGVPYVRSPVTHRRWASDPKKTYALVNYLIQGVAAEVFKQKLLQLDAMGLGEYMCIPVHDEVILDVPLAEVPEVAKMVREGMTDETSFAVPITAGVATGTNWRDKEEWFGE